MDKMWAGRFAKALDKQADDFNSSIHFDKKMYKQDITGSILALISLLIVITLLRRMVNIFPSLIACLIRSKESTNLEMSVKLSNDRNKLALAMILPLILVATRFHLYSPVFMADMEENTRICVIAGVFIAYILLRTALMYLVRPLRMKSGAYSTANKAAYTFFIILTLILLATGGIMSFMDIDFLTIHNAMIWLSGGIYLLFLLRKCQIFMSSCSIFTAFLYLCALEIFPTGILVVSAIIF